MLQKVPIGRVEVPVHVHVVNQGQGGANGDIPQETIDRQIAHLNDAFAPWGFHFTLDSLDRTTNAAWYDATDTDEYRDMKRALHQGGADELNLYVKLPAGGVGMFGHSTMPWEAAEDLPLDGVMVSNVTLPGSARAESNEGDTSVHEVGHWLGLFHTFQGGCEAPGDQVSDTPAEAERGSLAEGARDSCPLQPGTDPLFNFMDYSDDPIASEFTPGQAARMHANWDIFRNLGGGPTAHGRAQVDAWLGPQAELQSSLDLDRDVRADSMKLAIGMLSKEEIDSPSLYGPPPPSEDLCIRITAPSGKEVVVRDRMPGEIVGQTLELGGLFPNEPTKGRWTLSVQNANPQGTRWHLEGWELTVAEAAER